MFLLKDMFRRVPPALVLSILFIFAGYSIAAAMQPTSIRPVQRGECSSNNQVVQILSAQKKPVQCLPENGTYLLPEGDTACNESFTQYLVASLRPAIAQKYGFNYQDHGQCITGQKEGTSFRIVQIPIVRDQATCQQDKGVFVSSLQQNKILMQCLHQGSIYNIQKITRVCNFTARGEILMTRKKSKMTLSAGQACYEREITATKYYHTLFFTLPTTQETA